MVIHNIGLDHRVLQLSSINKYLVMVGKKKSLSNRKGKVFKVKVNRTKHKLQEKNKSYTIEAYKCIESGGSTVQVASP